MAKQLVKQNENLSYSFKTAPSLKLVLDAVFFVTHSQRVSIQFFLMSPLATTTNNTYPEVYFKPSCDGTGLASPIETPIIKLENTTTGGLKKLFEIEVPVTGGDLAPGHYAVAVFVSSNNRETTLEIQKAYLVVRGLKD